MSLKTTSAITITTAATTNNLIPTTKMSKTANSLKPSKKANLLKATSETSSEEEKVTKPAVFKATTAPKLIDTTKVTTTTTSTPKPTPIPIPTSVTTLTASIPTSTKIDPYSILSFAVSSSSSMSSARMSTMKEGIMSYHNVIAVFTLLFLFCGLASVDGLKCHMCGQYNEGVGSITPCLNYSEQYAHLYLKDCSKSSEKFCVKYVSELSTVRDCATECAEKEVWETQTYCCNTDGCNGAGNLEASVAAFILPVFYLIYKAFKLMFEGKH